MKNIKNNCTGGLIHSSFNLGKLFAFTCTVLSCLILSPYQLRSQTVTGIILGDGELFSYTHTAEGWGSRNIIDDTLLSPQQGAFDLQGNAYVTGNNSSLQAIYQYTYDGTSWQKSTVSSNPGTTNYNALAVAADGTLYSGQTTLYKFAFNGTSWTRTTAFTNGMRPDGAPNINIVSLAVDASGNLFIGDFASNSILFLAAENIGNTDKKAVVFASDVGDIRGLSFDEAGNLYAASNSKGTVYRFENTESGLSNLAENFLATSRPNGVAFDGDGNLYVSGGSDGSGYIYRYDNTGSGLNLDSATIIASGLSSTVKGLAVTGSSVIPEPATISLLLGLGIIVVPLIKRHRSE